MTRPLLIQPGLSLSPDGTALRHPWFLIQCGVIQACGEGEPRDLPTDLERIVSGDSILVPGFVNAHTHLSLTPLADRLAPTRDFWQWIFDLVEMRSALSPEEVHRGIAEGLEMALASGTVALLDFSGNHDMPHTPLRHLVAHEIIAFHRSQCAEAMQSWAQLGSRLAAPHAVYSTTPELIEMLADQIRRLDGLLTIHLSETEDENQLWQIGVSDGLSRYYAHFGIDRRDWQCPRCSPTQHLARLGALGPHALLVHCNHLSEVDIELIQSSGASVCFCPASHRFFGHGPHPLPRLLEAGVPVCLGTDSLASSPSLSMWDQVRLVAESHPEIGWPTLLAMITSGCSRALRLPGAAGTLRAGAPADLVLLSPEPEMSRVHQCPRVLFEGGVKILDVLISGRSALAN